MTHTTHHHGRVAKGRVLSALAVLALAFALMLLAAPPAAGGNWSQTYAANTWFGPGGIAYSGNNYSIAYNAVSFSSNGVDYMQLTLCNTTPSCYEYTYSTTSFDDRRSISYGHAKCNAWQYNYYSLWVNYCYTNNF